MKVKPPYLLPASVPLSEVDRCYHLRKSTARAAFDAGLLRGIKRKGRGGEQVWVLPEDARDWFLRGLPTKAPSAPIVGSDA